MREALETREDIAALTLLNTAIDMKRTMRAESDDYAQNMRHCDAELWSDDEGKPMSDPTEDDERVEITGLRSPITINYGGGQQPEPKDQQPATQPAQQLQPTMPAPTNTVQPDPLWKRAALAGAKYVLPAAAAAGGAYWLAQPGEQPPAVEQPASYLEYGVDVGPPAEPPRGDDQ